MRWKLSNRNAGPTAKIVPKSERQAMRGVDAEILIGFGHRSRQKPQDWLSQ